MQVTFTDNRLHREEAILKSILDTAVAAKATRVLIEAGHERIAGIFKGDDGQGPLRYKGYLKAMTEAGLKTQQETVVWLDTPETVHLSDIEDYLFRRIEGCTGAVCYNDQVAYQLIESAARKGISVPADLSVVGIDDSYLAAVGKVPFTSFVHPKEILGRKVAENLLNMIADPSFDGNYLFDCEVVNRDSVRRV